MRFNNRLNYLLYMVLSVFALYSCNTTKYLKDDEFLLEKNIIEVDTDAPKSETGSLEWNLSTLTKQKPNKKSLRFTRARLWWHYKAMNHIEKRMDVDSSSNRMESDTSRFYKFILRRVAEPPAIYSKAKTEDAAQSMEYYLNNRGFYQAAVDTEVSTKKRLVTVKYKVKTEKFMRIGDVEYMTDDLNIRPLLQELKATTLLKPGIPLDSRTFNQEKTRIIRILKDEGFGFVYPTNIIYEGDSSGLSTNVKMIILPPSDSTFHQKYHIGKIYIHTEYYPAQNVRTKLVTEKYKGYHFISPDSASFKIKKDVLVDAMLLHPDSLYRFSDHEKTRKRLGRLSVYKFVSVKAVPNPDASKNGQNYMDFYVYLTPAKKMDVGANGAVNYISGDRILGEALGLFLNMNYRNRNVFKGGQLLSLSAGYGIESPISSTTLIDFRNTFTQDVRLQADLSLPPFSNNANFRYSTAYNLVQRFQQYSYNLFNTEVGIDWANQSNKIITFHPLSINYLSSTIEPEFQPFLDANPLLDRSFDPQLIMGMNGAFSYSHQNSKSRESYSFRANFDVAGTMLNLLDRIINPDEAFRIGNITYSQYSLIELDGRYFKTYNRNFTLGARLNTGIAVPYGNSSETGMPYVKQFFSGGNTSIRAWRVRQLGPGGVPEPQLDDIIPFQTGDFKLEGNLEARFNLGFLLSGLEGAAFIDAGNVWSLTDSTDNNVKMLAADNFLNRIAIGAGTGVRLDFSFFILRVDYAWRIRRPYSAVGNDDDLSTYWEQQHVEQLPINEIQPWYMRGRVNLAIGYPF